MTTPVKILFSPVLRLSAVKFWSLKSKLKNLKSKLTSMLTQLSTVKDRLALTVTTYDTLLTNAIKAVSARLDHLTNRTLSRTVDFTQEFIADETELVLSCYPLESVSSF